MLVVSPWCAFDWGRRGKGFQLRYAVLCMLTSTKLCLWRWWIFCGEKILGMFWCLMLSWVIYICTHCNDLDEHYVCIRTSVYLKGAASTVMWVCIVLGRPCFKEYIGILSVQKQMKNSLVGHDFIVHCCPKFVVYLCDPERLTSIIFCGALLPLNFIEV